MLRLYAILAEAFGPLAARAILCRNPKLDGKTLPERFARRGLPEALPAGRRIWLNAASVGETMALLPFVAAWRKINASDTLVVTNTTVTGHERAQKTLGEVASWLGYLPLDIPSVVRRVVDALRPDAFITVEAEAWPNLLFELGKRGIPRVLINGRMTLANKRGLKRSITAQIWRMFDLVIARSGPDYDAFLELGVAREKLHTSGELKLDVEMPALAPDALETLKGGFGLDEANAWVAASTHPGEEELALDVEERLRASHPQSRLILVPRHPERFDEVAALIEKRCIGFHRYSDGAGGADKPVLLLDAMGVLADFFQACGLAVVFGSFFGPGVHSVIEPAAYGKPVVAGPRTFNTDIPERMAEAGALAILRNPAELYPAVKAWADGGAVPGTTYGFAEMGGEARQFIAESRGAAARTAEIVSLMLAGM